MVTRGAGRIMKKLLALALALCMLTGVCGAFAAEAGETVEVTFSMLSNPGNAYMIKITLEYDHEALELVPNDIFDMDSYLAKFNENLSAVFRIREDARPGTYPVTIRAVEASDSKGNLAQLPTYSGAAVTVELPPVEVPVYYFDAATGELLKADSATLPAGRTSTVKAEAPEGWVVTGGQSIQVTVTEDGEAIPSMITFWLAVPEPTATPLPGISLDIMLEVGSNHLSWNPVSGAERYRVYRGTSGNGNYDILAAVDGITYTDSAVRGGTTYYYMVEAVFPNGQTVAAQKSAVAATPMPSPTPLPDPKSAKAGDYIIFGHYEQDNNTGNGKEPIEWLVLEVRGNKALVISKYGLDAQPYSMSDQSMTWETCGLRKWLNGEFLNNAFSSGEQTAIIRMTVDNSSEHGYSTWNTIGGKNTEDRVFLLSYAEANKYLGVTVENTDNMRSRMSPTAYAEKMGAVISQSHKTADGVEAGWWWLRSPGHSRNNAAGVDADGSLEGSIVYDDLVCVRPALWINLDSGIF